ncbi:hypothetical protein AGMMS50256_21910 [Betaproteobacteria bacterium]|nr:hypothetical protein AGMMS50256_21910 [Betaproteobacteria bacterium]
MGFQRSGHGNGNAATPAASTTGPTNSYICSAAARAAGNGECSIRSACREVAGAAIPAVAPG